VSTAKVVLGLTPDLSLGEAGGAVATVAGELAPSQPQDAADGVNRPLGCSNTRAESGAAWGSIRQIQQSFRRPITLSGHVQSRMVND
jgi:hypothetical protein